MDWNWGVNPGACYSSVGSHRPGLNGINGSASKNPWHSSNVCRAVQLMQEVTYPPDQGREDQAGKAFFFQQSFFFVVRTVFQLWNHGYILYVYFQFAWKVCWKAWICLQCTLEQNVSILAQVRLLFSWLADIYIYIHIFYYFTRFWYHDILCVSQAWFGFAAVSAVSWALVLRFQA